MYKYNFSATSKKSTFWSRTNITYRSDNTATQIYPSHPGDRITCSPPPSVTQLGGGCLKAVTLTHSSILPNHPPTVPHSRGEQERGRGRQTQGEELTREGEEWGGGGRAERGKKHQKSQTRRQTHALLDEETRSGKAKCMQCCLSFSSCPLTQLRENKWRERWGWRDFLSPPHLPVCWVRTYLQGVGTHDESLQPSPTWARLTLNRSSLSRCAEDVFYFYRFYSRRWVVLTHFFHV